MSNQEYERYLEIIWEHCEDLAVDVFASHLQRMQLALAYLLSDSQYPPEELAGFAGVQRPDQDGDDLQRFRAMEQHVAPALTGTEPLELASLKAIAFWPVDGHGYPLGKLPAEGAWFASKKANLIFEDRKGAEPVGYFEAHELNEDGLIRVTSYRSRRHAMLIDERPLKTEGLSIAAVAALIFVMVVCSVLETGIHIASARSEVATAGSDINARLRTRVEERCSADEAPTLGGLCQEGELRVVGKDSEADEKHNTFDWCLRKIAPTEAAESTALTPACGEVWREALRLVGANAKEAKTQQNALENVTGFVVTVMTPFSPSASSLASSRGLSLVSSLILMIASLMIFLIGLGRARTGLWKGVWISEQNRISLSRFQIVIWTVVLLSAYALYAAFNVGAMGAAWQTVIGDVGPTNDNSLFPALPVWAWAVLGITVASPLASSLIKGQKPEGWDEYFKGLQDRGGQKRGVALKPLARNATPQRASFWDLVFGEDMLSATEGKGSYVDPTRVQLLLLTVILVMVYAVWLGISLSSLGYSEILGKFPEANAILSSFPAPDGAFTGLLALTHGVYIAGKWPIGKT